MVLCPALRYLKESQSGLQLLTEQLTIAFFPLSTIYLFILFIIWIYKTALP